MTTSQNKIQQTEDFLIGRMEPGEKILFKAKLILDPVLKVNTAFQRKVYQLITLYGRRKIKAEIEKVQHTIFNDPSSREFQNRIHRLF
jgi:hypothetical protein